MLLKIEIRSVYLTAKEMEKVSFEVPVPEGWKPFNIHLRSTTPEERKEVGKPNCFHVLDIWFYEQ